MPNDAEEKKIARLDFYVDDAIDSLNKINKELKKIAQESEKYSKTIGKNLNGAINADKMIDTKSVKVNIDEINKIVEAGGKNYLNTLAKEQLEHTRTEEFKKRQAIKTAEEQIRQNNRVAQSTQTLYDKITQYAKTYVIYQGFNELRKAISETIDEMVEVEQQMVAIDRVLNESGLDIDHYRDKLIQLAADYGNSFDNVADVTLRLAQAGFDSQEALALTEKTLLALNTAELNATQATGDMVSVMSQWGLMTGDAAQEAKDYGDIIDKINKVADNYPTTSADIMEALKKVSSAFNLAGASIDETIATIVAAEKASQRGGKVIGTALSNITQQLKAEGKLNLAEELGLDFFKDADKTEFKNIIDIFQEMADRMEQLKAEGKESSTEMQSLLELFTVFRRNVGASLLGEMSGEDNTYLNVLNDSLTATGYSLQENEKYMKTAKAAQAQLNAELLKLKTQVWDGGLEDVFRGMLSMGTDLVKGLEGLIKTFGVIPTSLGAITLAYTALSGKVKVQNLRKLTDQIKAVNKEIQTTGEGLNKDSKSLNGASEGFKNYAVSVEKGKASLVGYAKQTAIATAKTMLLNAAISVSLTAAITFLASTVDDLIHAEEKAIEKNKEIMQTAQDNADKIRAEREERENLTKELENTIKKYNQLDADDPERTETATKLYELQTQINKQLEGSGKQISIINESLDAQNKTVISINDEWEKQIGLLQQISYQDKVREVEQLKDAMEAANKNLQTINLDTLYGGDASPIGMLKRMSNQEAMAEALSKAGITKRKGTILGGIDASGTLGSLQKDFLSSDIEKQISLLREWKLSLEAINDGDETVTRSLEMVGTALTDLNERYDTANSLTEKYNKSLQELYGDTYRLTGYQSALQDIMNTYKDDSAVQELGNALTRLNKDFADGKISADDYFNALNGQLKNVKDTIITDGNDISRGMQAIFAETTKYIAQGLDEAVHSYEEGTSTFYEYQDILAQSTQGLIELYAEQNGLNAVVKDSITYWEDAEGNVNDYATALQNSTDTVAAYSDMLRDLADSYDYIAEHADAAGNANFDYEQVSSEAYQNLAANFASHLETMRKVNFDSWAAIVGTMEDGASYVTSEEANVSEYVAEALASNNNDLNAALNAANAQAQESANKLGQSTGNLLQSLGEAISSFDYEITATPFISGGFGLKTNELGIPTGINLPSFGFNITGSGGSSIKNLGAALQTFGQDFSTYVSNQTGYQSLLSSIRPYKSSNANPFAGGGGYSSPSSGGGSSGGGGGGGGGSSSRATSDAEREAQEEYKARLNAFKEFVKERERLEKRWVDKQKDLGLLSNQDYLYITQQRIERYKEYLAEVEKATWMSEEDRLALEQEYSEKIEDLETDYLKYYRTKLDDDIDALKKQNQEKINLIKDEATERINALKKVEDENDRIRSKEEYEKRRLEHLEDISYWEQRTGRQAQEALKEAKKNLAELDEQWQEQMEDWSIEDQIKAIEEQRDTQIQAIEDAQEKEIKSIEDMYNKKLQLFAETGKIIYESSGIQSQALYNQYKSKFIDPLKRELASLKNALNPSKPAASSSPAPAPAPQYIEYTVDPGDTLWDIAEQIYGDGSMWTKIYDENQDVIGGNPGLIYPGQVFNIPQFHQGGIFNPDEGLAILKKNEMILKPEWTPSMLKMMKYIDKNINSQGNPINNGNNIEVNRKFS